jgi:uncharacterized protein YkwD
MEVWMNVVRFHKEALRCLTLLFCLAILFSNRTAVVRAQGGFDPSVQTPALLHDEAETVYLGNLARRDHGIPPLRWNLQLTHAARWFSWDSTENRASGFCGHDDSQGHNFVYRTTFFGYPGFASAENAFCSYLSPQAAIDGWMNSPGHRTNLLSANSREIGLGYYRRSSDGRGYVTQDFGSDAVYAPVIIENEAISTTNPNVNLYIYNRSSSGGFAGFDAATQMMVSNKANFSGATWEPFNTNKAWTVVNGSGWRDVYVKTRDKFNRSAIVSDAIYLGDTVPLDELGDAQMSTTQSNVTLYNLNGGGYPQLQLSLGWLADDTLGSFAKNWGNGGRVNDVAALGGTAYRLFPGDGESFAWVYDTGFITDTPMTAYFRLKVNNNSSNDEVARISVQGGPTEYGPLSLQGTDFTAPNQYQEFAINFTFSPTSNDPFLIFKFWRSGSADLYVDAVYIFTAPQNITSPLVWSVPGGNYRGQGVWVRYTNGTQFSDISEAQTVPFEISGNVGVGGAKLSYNDGTAKEVFSDGSGNYSLLVPFGWSGTVTPSHPCFTFSPGSHNYNNVTDNIGGQNYTPTPAGICVSSITRANDTPTNLASVDFTVTFTTSVTGVDMGDFDLTTSGVSNAAITNLTGSSAIYTVSVNTGTGNGTIRLDLMDDDSIVDGANHPLGGAGAGNGDFNSGETYSILKTAPKPSVPVLLTPAPGAIVGSLQPVFDWQDSIPAAHHYQIQISTNVAFTALVENQTDLLTSTFTASSPLEHGKLYYWHVRAFNAIGGTSNWSAVRNFKTPLDAPTLGSPSDGSNLITDRPDFDWSDVTGASQYVIQVAVSATFSPLLLNATTNVSSYSANRDLPQNKLLYWRVAAKTSSVMGPWSSPAWSFTTGNPATVPILASPANNALVRDYTPLLSWNDAMAPAGTSFKQYELQLDDDADFSSPTINLTTTISEFQVLTDLASNSKFYWRVRAVNTVGVVDHFSGWSVLRYFRTVILAPQSITVIPNGLRPRFDWDDAIGPGAIKNYSIQVSISPSFGTLLVNGVTVNSFYDMLKDLPSGKTVFWRVRVNGANGPSGWSTGQYIVP